MPDETLAPTPLPSDEELFTVERVYSQQVPGIDTKPQPPRVGYEYDRQTEQSDVPESLALRTEQAMLDCEINPTPEVRGALIGYYHDHYQLAAIVGGATDGSISNKTIDTLSEQLAESVSQDSVNKALESIAKTGNVGGDIPVLAGQAMMLAAIRAERQANADGNEAVAEARRVSLQCAAILTERTLFQENALGISTLSDSDFNMVRELHGAIMDASISGGAELVNSGYNQGGYRWPKATDNSQTALEVYSSESLITTLHEKKDHFWEDCRRAGQLEYHSTGHMDRVMVTHSLQPRAEQHRRTGVIRAQTDLGIPGDSMHSNVPHFSEHLDITDMYTRGKAKGTVAVPLAAIINVAPFARDAQYAVVTPRDARTLDRIPVSKAIERKTNPGTHDLPGRGGSDRTFYVSPTESGDISPDGYAIDLYPYDTYQIYVQGRDYTDPAEVQMQAWYSIGTNLPYPIFTTDEEAEATVDAIQTESLDRFGNQLVVPLRRGLFSFNAEGQGAGSFFRARRTSGVLPEDISRSPATLGVYN